MHTCQRWYSCWKHCWIMLAGGSHMASLVAVMTSLAKWIYAHVEVLSCGERDKNRMVRDQVYVGCGKMVTCCLANSSWTRTERWAGALSCSNSQFLLCQSSGRLQRIESRKQPRILLKAGFVYSYTFWDEFHVNNSILIKKKFKYQSKNSSSITLPFDLCCCSFSVVEILAFSRSPQIVMRSSRWSCIRMHGTLCWVTRDMFRSSVKFCSMYHG